ncbi:TPA: DUF1492 domain-containing protein [Escherichia coli]|nr:DUF1492 domain-containing protein [Escherichia coli]
MPAFEWVHVQLHQQKGMISLSPPTICNSALERTNDGRVIAMAAGVKFGRKPHRKSVIALQFIRQKMTAEAVMNKTGISRATYYRLKKVALNPF